MGGLQKERITELSLEQTGICLMYILNQVKWRGGGREIEMIERETERERGRWETKKKEVVETKEEEEKEKVNG